MHWFIEPPLDPPEPPDEGPTTEEVVHGAWQLLAENGYPWGYSPFQEAVMNLWTKGGSGREEEAQGQGRDHQERLLTTVLPPGRMWGHPQYYRILLEMADLHEAKARDYSGVEGAFANFRRARRLGVRPYIACLVRLLDKVSRIENLTVLGETGSKIRDETLFDTLRDLAAYAIIAEVLLTEERTMGIDAP